MENFDLQQYAETFARAESFPLGEVLICILVATACVAALLVLAWFLFKTRFPRSFDRGKGTRGSDRGD